MKALCLLNLKNLNPKFMKNIFTCPNVQVQGWKYFGGQGSNLKIRAQMYTIIF